MSSMVVFQQMLVIFLLLLIGAVIYKKGKLTDETTQNLSWIVINLCSPALLICAVMEENQAVTKESVLLTGGICIAFYVILVLISHLLSFCLKIKGADKVSYIMMTIFGNVGFIGIPVTAAILGTEALIYVAIFNFVYDILFYTYGIFIMQKVSDKASFSLLSTMINPGVLACVLVVIIFWFELPMPVIPGTVVEYLGGAATCLSLFVIGASLAQMKVGEMLQDKKLLLFIVVRFLLIPIGFAILLKPVLPDLLIRGTIVLMSAVPVGNLGAMLARQYDVDESQMVRGIVISTVLSVVTITIAGTFI